MDFHNVGEFPTCQSWDIILISFVIRGGVEVPAYQLLSGVTPSLSPN